MNYRIYLIAVFLFPLLACSSRAMEIATGGKASVILVAGSNPSIPEQTAIRELQTYLNKVTGGKFILLDEKDHVSSSPAIYVGNTAYAKTKGIDIGSLDSEEWVIKAVGSDLILAGGRPRGTLYAVYRFLEEVVGVHWWNPMEEFVPQKKDVVISELDLRGKPAFAYRDIYRDFVTTDDDGGWFAARNRLNRDGDHVMGKEVGGSFDYGPPALCHTFNLYIPEGEYFKDHPEFYSLIDGKRVTGNQLCLSNPQMRKLFLEKLKKNILDSRRQADAKGISAPSVFDVSANDCRGPCQCERCEAIVNRTGGESGIMIDFLNFLSDGISKEYPNVFISTLAYYHTQAAPANIRPRKNIIIRLCDTVSNQVASIQAPENASFRKRFQEWRKLTPNMRIWEYGVTYHYSVLPFPNEDAQARKLRYYFKNKVEGVFYEHEYPERGEMHDMKVWVLAKLLEEPNRNYEDLVTVFTDGYYGKAGGYIREYRKLIDTSRRKHNSFINWFASLSSMNYLDMKTLVESERVFDQAEVAVKDDPVCLSRVRFARLPVDRATYLMWRKLTGEWGDQGKPLKEFPLNRRTVIARAKQTWLKSIEGRLQERRKASERKIAEEEITLFAGLPETVGPAEFFKTYPVGQVHDFTPELAKLVSTIKVVSDREAEIGYAAMYELSTPEDLEKLRLPMCWGLYDTQAEVNAGGGQIKAEDVPGPGYHWYRLGTFTLKRPVSLYFFWNWHMQLEPGNVIRPDLTEQPFEFWARIKFSGPIFPHGQKEDKNAIYIERVSLVGK